MKSGEQGGDARERDRAGTQRESGAGGQSAPTESGPAPVAGSATLERSAETDGSGAAKAGNGGGKLAVGPQASEAYGSGADEGAAPAVPGNFDRATPSGDADLN